MLYSALGIEPSAWRSAAPRDIRVAFKRRALSVHPDKGGSREAFHLVLDAFETLSDPGSRNRYDRSLGGSAPPRPAPPGDPGTAEKRRRAPVDRLRRAFEPRL